MPQEKVEIVLPRLHKIDISDKQLRPFLRWAGGKQALRASLLSRVPREFNLDTNCYIEPFLGAGSLYLALSPQIAILSDLNKHIINCFKAIKIGPTDVHDLVRGHIRRSSEVYYYRVRELFNRKLSEHSIEQAARFLYLNRASFNGVFRVNSAGEYNVPYSRSKNVTLPPQADLILISKLLRGARLLATDFETTLDYAVQNDFVYLDPPYPPINGTSYFTHYTKERFGISDQKSVANLAKQLSKRGCFVMVTNADLPEIRSLYKGWRLETVDVVRYITCKKVRHKVGELIITNYNYGGEG